MRIQQLRERDLVTASVLAHHDDRTAQLAYVARILEVVREPVRETDDQDRALHRIRHDSTGQLCSWRACTIDVYARDVLRNPRAGAHPSSDARQRIALIVVPNDHRVSRTHGVLVSAAMIGATALRELEVQIAGTPTEPRIDELLHERADWTAAFGGITQPCVERYRPPPRNTLRATPAEMVRSNCSNASKRLVSELSCPSTSSHGPQPVYGTRARAARARCLRSAHGDRRTRRRPRRRARSYAARAKRHRRRHPDPDRARASTVASTVIRICAMRAQCECELALHVPRLGRDTSAFS